MKSGAGAAVGFLSYKAITLALAVLPRRAVLWLGAGVGRLAFRLDRGHRRIVEANLATAFAAEMTPDERDRLARRAFAELGRMLLDILKATHMSRDRIYGLFEIEGRSHLERALAGGKGALLFTGHFGNWEFTIPALTSIGPLQAIHRELDNPRIERDLHRLREKLGAGTISKFGASKPVLQALARNEIVAILIDLNVLHSSGPVFVDFFGRPAATTPALAAFHLKTGAPIVPMFCEPLARGRYRMTLHEPLVFEGSGDREADVLKITRTCTNMIERQIRRRPELWFWVHKRWNTRPAGETPTT
jgi:Kdo2-lipid IVA lauroyltransferase/acyltransferase